MRWGRRATPGLRDPRCRSPRGALVRAGLPGPGCRCPGAPRPAREGEDRCGARGAAALPVRVPVAALPGGARRLLVRARRGRGHWGKSPHPPPAASAHPPGAAGRVWLPQTSTSRCAGAGKGPAPPASRASRMSGCGSDTGGAAEVGGGASGRCLPAPTAFDRQQWHPRGGRGGSRGCGDSGG